MKIAYLFSTAFFLATSLAAQTPMGNMHGGCSSYTADLKNEMHLMSLKPAEIAAAADAAHAPEIGTSRVFSVSLVPQTEVRFAVPPGQDRGGTGRRAGLLSLGILPKGHWRVSTDQPIWVDLVASGQLAASPSFEMQTECPAILKTVVFEVSGSTSVLLQINGATIPSVRLLVTLAEGHP